MCARVVDRKSRDDAESAAVALLRVSFPDSSDFGSNSGSQAERRVKESKEGVSKEGKAETRRLV